MKREMKKWLLGFSMAMLILFCRGSKVSAAEVKEVNVEGYRLEENRMYLYLNTDAATEPTTRNLDLFLGDRQCEALKVSSFDSLQEGISYLILVDVSGSVTQADLESTKEILKKLVELKAEEDNVSIMEIKNEIEATDFSSNKAALTEQIESIQRTKEDTNLYLAVREGLKLLAEEETCFEKKCMIIFSDGMDDQKNGILFEDVRDGIKNSNVPICTLAMPFTGTLKGEEAPDKVLKSFTDNGAGGVHVRLEDYEMTAEEIATAFSEFAHSGVVAEISLEGFETNGSQVELTVGMEGNEEKIQADSLAIPSHEIASVIVAQIEEVEEELQEEVVETVETEKNGYLLGLLVGGVLLVTATIIFLTSKKKGSKLEGKEVAGKEPKELTTGTGKAENDANEKEAKLGNASEQGCEVSGNETSNQTSSQISMEESKRQGITIELTEIGPNSERVLRKYCEDTVVIGRRKTADIVIAEDLQVSGYHCKLSFDGDGLYVQDLDSTNGTFLNGVPVSGRMQLSQDDVMFIGSFEYRISWE